MSKQTDEITGLKRGTPEKAIAVIKDRIRALEKVALHSVKLSERRQAKVHADMLREVVKEIFSK